MWPHLRSSPVPHCGVGRGHETRWAGLEPSEEAVQAMESQAGTADLVRGGQV